MTVPTDHGAPATAPDTVQTFSEIALPDAVRDALGEQLGSLPDPNTDIDRSTARLLQIFATLPTGLLQQTLDFGRHIDTPGVALVSNLPVDSALPATPSDGGPSTDKRSFVAEGVLLGLSGLLGEPMGVLTEKAGQLRP